MKKGRRKVKKLWVEKNSVVMIWNHVGKLYALRVRLKRKQQEVDKRLQMLLMALLRTMIRRVYVGKGTRVSVDIVRRRV